MKQQVATEVATKLAATDQLMKDNLAKLVTNKVCIIFRIFFISKIQILFVSAEINVLSFLSLVVDKSLFILVIYGYAEPISSDHGTTSSAKPL